ncbi:hypothetical protein N7445_010296 [Penicillium cf. griseofulvum]|nr:hypothetical protein N7445_010296 [Penicillium cf. griseofulvum]
MRLRSNHVLPPISEYIPRRRRQTRSASAQAGTEAGPEVAAETATEVAHETVPEAQSAEERPAPKRKPAKRAGRKKKAAPKGKKPAASTETEAAESQETSLALIPSVEQPDTRTLPPKPTRAPAPKRMVRGRDISAVLRYGSAGDLLKTERRDPAPSPPQTPVKQYAWPPGIAYSKLKRIPWSLPWSPPSPPKAWPHLRSLHFSNTLDEPELTRTEELSSRKRNRLPEEDPSPSKRHKLTPGFENRPRGSSRRTYADRARRREAERDGRIDRTIYRFPQLLAQQGEDSRSDNSSPPATHASEETTPRGNRIVPFSSLPSALPPNQNQNQNQNQNRHGWRQWIFSSVTGLWRRDNAPQNADTPQVAEPQHPTANESSSSVATPSSAPPSSSLVQQRNFQTPTPRQRIAASRPSNAPHALHKSPKEKKYSYDLDPPGFDPELLARMRARQISPEELQVVTSPDQVRERYENECKKRKRSPDVIPHPPGCSYGFDPDYFVLDEDDEDDDLPIVEDRRQDTKTKQATVSDAPEEEHVSKRARSNNTHMENAPEVEHVSKRAQSDNTHMENAPEVKHVPKPVHSGTAHLEKYKANAPLPENTAEELRKAREQAEQYKPKTPSRLRAAHRFSSSCSDYYPEEETMRRCKMRKTSLAKACPTGDLNNIIWPETEPWIERFDWDLPGLKKTLSLAYPLRKDELCENYHQFFMHKLAERRARH